MRPKVKIDWDTVELVGVLEPALPVLPPAERAVDRAADRTPRLFHDRRGRSIVKQILSGAAQKARARGAIYTHTQLRKLLPAGLPTLVYGLWLLAAAMESDLSRGVELAAQAISETSHRVLRR